MTSRDVVRPRSRSRPRRQDILRRYFTNLDGPVFALVNLPEVVKGALFARYAAAPRASRRLFLDEFVGDLDIAGDQTVDATVGLQRAEELYEQVFFEYGDDSVAQLGGVHLACEQASNLLTKILEWGRLASYLEQSTRYIAYDARLGGRYRYYRDPADPGQPLGTRYVGDLDRLFDTYSRAGRRGHRPRAGDGRPSSPATATSSTARPPGPRPSTPSGACCPPPPSERRHLRLRPGLRGAARCGCGPTRCPRPGTTAELMLHELRKVIPSFLQRRRRPDRGGAWSDYLEQTRTATAEIASSAVRPTRSPPDAADGHPGRLGPGRRGQAAGRDAATPHRPARARSSLDRVRRLAADERVALLRAYVGDRDEPAPQARAGPSSAPTTASTSLADYGAFRDLQRHRLLTIEWQPLTPAHGYVRARAGRRAPAAPRRSTPPWAARPRSTTPSPTPFPEQAPTPSAWPTGSATSCSCNAREAMHLARAALGAAGPPGVPAHRPGHAPPDRRAGRPPGASPRRCAT